MEKGGSLILTSLNQKTRKSMRKEKDTPLASSQRNIGIQEMLRSKVIDR
jgi:hypothetical protein